MNLKKIFSITNEKSKKNKWYKVIYIVGVKFAFRNKRKEECVAKEKVKKIKRKIKEYEKIINSSNTLKWALLDAFLEDKKEYQYEPIKNRLCYCLKMALPQNLSGYSTRSHYMAKALDKVFDLKVVTYPNFPWNNYTSDKPFEMSDEYDGIIYYHQKMQSLKITGNIEGQISIVDKYVETFLDFKPEYVVAASNNQNAIPILIACRKLGIPFYYEVRGLWELTNIANHPENKIKVSYYLEKYYETIVCNEADGVFTLTQAIVDEMADRGCDRNKFYLVPNCVDVSMFESTGKDKTLLDKYNLSEYIPVIGYCGTVQHYEGIDDLIKACKIINDKGIDFRLVIVGGNARFDKEDYIQYLENLSKELQLSDKIIFTGKVNPEEVAKYYSIMDITPFGRKPFEVCKIVSPIKPVEAMAMEKCVVVSDLPALKEMVVDNETGLYFKAGDINSYAEVLEKLIVDKELRNSLAKNGKKWVEENRQWYMNANVIKQVLVGEKENDK